MARLPKSKVPAARKYWMGTKGHLKILEIVTSSQRLDQMLTHNYTWVALQNTLCLTVELALKAAIATFPGETPGGRKHDLKALLEDAVRLKIIEVIQAKTEHDFEGALIKFVDEMAANYLENDYRYFESADLIVQKSPRAFHAIMVIADLLLTFAEERFPLP